MGKILSVFTACLLTFSLVGGELVNAKSRSVSKPSTRSYNSKPQKKIVTPKTSQQPQKNVTSKPKSSENTGIVEKPKTDENTKTSTKSNTNEKKHSKNSTQIKNKKYSSPYYRGGSFAPYLLTAAGVYLLYQGLEDDGDPIYVNAETGEEVDDDDLEDLGAEEISDLPGASSATSEPTELQETASTPEKTKDTNTNNESIFWKTLIAILMVFLLIGGIILFIRRKK